jgi:hypothetical protein
MSSAVTHGGKGPTHGWGTAGERGRGVAAGGVDWRSDRVRKKAWGKQEEEEGWFGEEAKEEARGAAAHTLGSRRRCVCRSPLSPSTPAAVASAVFSPSVFSSAGRCVSGVNETDPFLGRGLDEP